LFPESWRAVTEAVRAEEDERLGRWRWPENPDYVVYVRISNEIVTVFSEARGLSVDASRGTQDAWVDDERPWKRHALDAASAYFDAHPQPKPWHSAKEGDVWEFKLGREHFDFFTGLPYSRDMTRLFQRTTGGWRVIGRKNWFLNESEVSAARPVWSYPEGDS
jgi:hypothetical protein